MIMVSKLFETYFLTSLMKTLQIFIVFLFLIKFTHLQKQTTPALSSNILQIHIIQLLNLILFIEIFNTEPSIQSI